MVSIVLSHVFFVCSNLHRKSNNTYRICWIFLLKKWKASLELVHSIKIGFQLWIWIFISENYIEQKKWFKEAIQFASSHGKFESMSCQLKPGSMIISVTVYHKTIQVFALVSDNAMPVLYSRNIPSYLMFVGDVWKCVLLIGTLIKSISAPRSHYI